MARPIHKVLFIEPRSPQEHIFSRVAIPRLGSLLLGTLLQQQGIEVFFTGQFLSDWLKSGDKVLSV